MQVLAVINIVQLNEACHKEHYRQICQLLNAGDTQVCKCNIQTTSGCDRKGEGTDSG